MKRFLSIKYSAGAFNFAMLLLRLVTGGLLISHGYSKLVRFPGLKNAFMNFAGLGSTTSLVLIIFAEFFCSILLILGLFTRFATLPIIIGMSVVVFVANNADFFGKAETSTLFLGAAITLLLCGPGRISVDGMIGK